MLMERNHKGKLSWTKLVELRACWIVKCLNCLKPKSAASHITVTPAIWVLKSNKRFKYSPLNFKTFDLKLDNIWCYLHLAQSRSISPQLWKRNKHWDWRMICQKVRQIDKIPDVVKFQIKGFEIKSYYFSWTVLLKIYLLCL